MPAFFCVVATDSTPTFEPLGQCQGKWYGVAQVEDEKEIERLRKLKKQEITEAEFAEAVKKKATLQQGYQDFREVPVATVAELVAKRPSSGTDAGAAATPVATSKPAAIPTATIQQPKTIPPRRKSFTVPELKNP